MTERRSPYGLVISDVDGTLVTTDKRLTERTVAAVRRMREAGVLFAITSSRPPRGLRMVTETLGIDTPVGGFNGGRIVDPASGPVAENLLPPQAARDAVRQLEAQGVGVWVFTGEDWLVTDPDGAYVEHERATVQFDPVVVPSFDGHLDRVAKLVGASRDFALLARCERELAGQLAGASVVRSQDYYLDITSRDANKGTVVRTLSQRLGVPREAILVLGDMRNDVPMFAQAGFSVAMGQAGDEVKAAASAVTAGNDADGFAQAIERHVLA
ncbi:Cof-type HAD-IIB family hydrolase [Marinivivus vitaminiproducens]|uniref:Cof-type HAD-IIB family hydrolase n=1 Tax=Marinivivus vitaminiproducens TaxID=3035935 RepID=UPI002798AE08|nr:Cof-type HAD-IIB family hydrolase [Geminicoccaceae bacterium SCSIO 64248]